MNNSGMINWIVGDYLNRKKVERNTYYYHEINSEQFFI
jgi:hypothetical protein